jgi:hypothetical protein
LITFFEDRKKPNWSLQSSLHAWWTAVS